MTAALICALSIAAIAQSNPTTSVRPDIHHLRALVVGISRYAKLPGGQQLQFGEADAVAFAELLRSMGVPVERLRVLTASEATTAAIKSAIGTWLALSAAETDVAVIYFSGHGFVEKEFAEPYLLGYDSDPKDPYGTALSVNDIQQALVRRVRAGSVLIIADAMRRDFFDPESEPLAAASFTRAFEQLSSAREGTGALLANGPHEFSREGRRWDGHGAFTRHLIDVLATARASASSISGGQIFDTLSSLLAEDTSNKQHVWRSGASLARIELPIGERPSTGSPPVARANAATTAASEPPRAEPAKEDSQPTLVAKADTRATTPAPSPTAIPAAPPPPASSTKTTPKSATLSPISSKPPVNVPPATPAAPRRNKRAVKRTAQPPNTANPRREASSTTADVEAVNPGASNAKPAPEPPSTEGPTSTATATRVTSTRGTSGAARATRASGKPVGAAPRPPSTIKPETPATPRASAPSVKLPEPISPAGAPPRPERRPPSAKPVLADAGTPGEPSVASEVPATATVGPAPSPIPLQLEVAIANGDLIAPRGASAWDLYQRLLDDPTAAASVARLKPLLAEALVIMGRKAVTDDIRSDNVADKLEDLKRAGEVLARARTVGAVEEVAALEKLRAALALTGLQFYDEAERALMQLQAAKVAGVENALGIVYQGKLDPFRAERAFKRAIELDPKLAAPHYNLALVYRAADKDGAIAELESAASLDPSSVVIAAALGEEYFSHQQWQRAAEAFRRAIKLQPSDETLHTKLGHALFSQGLTEEANREYQKATDLRRKQ